MTELVQMATLEAVMNSTSLWLIGLVFFLALVAAAVGGEMLRARIDTRRHDSGSDGYLLSAVLALLGLLIAFTFSLALSRYDNRREMVVEEGNAIGTLWLRATLAQGLQGAALRDAVKRYADIRLRLPTATDHDAVETETLDAQRFVWQHVRATLPELQPPIAATLVTAATDMFDAAARRKAERNARIPGRVLDW